MAKAVWLKCAKHDVMWNTDVAEPCWICGSPGVLARWPDFRGQADMGPSL